MRLLTLASATGPRLGVLVDGRRALDVCRLADEIGSRSAPRSLIEVLDQGDRAIEQLNLLLRDAPVDATELLTHLTLAPPLAPGRGNVLAVGSNYAKHAAEGAAVLGGPIPPPTVFTKAVTTVAGPFDDLAIDFAASREIDWEVEVAVVIGSPGKNIGLEKAMDHVFGYMVANDITARDVQIGWGGQYFKGKSFDYSCPLGPWVVTADEVPDPSDLHLRLLVNGVLKQDGSTSDMTYSIPEIVAWISKGMTLLPGTVICTGTPDGVGFARNPKEFLVPGDLVEAEVVELGRLANRITDGSHVEYRSLESLGLVGPASRTVD